MNKSGNLILKFALPLIAVYFTANNIGNISNVKFILGLPVNSLSTGAVIAVSYFLGVITGLIFLILNKNNYQNKIDFYEKKNEKLSQENEIKSDDKKALELKVAVLEKALENALNKNKEN